MKNAHRFKVGEAVMVQSTNIETEHANGMRGRVTGFEHACVRVECMLVGESHALHVSHDQLIRCALSA
ncbi:hypothetical protein PQR25_04650 [Paraburkholderia nemoris]|uniref:hypothetical protein n=1 Tax=Paraburkholderia nemoris TaxID=2793076 RepID=UPI0038B6D25D